MKLPVKYSTLDWKKGEKVMVRNKYIELQKGLCYYCNLPLTDNPPKEVTDKVIDLDL